MRTLKGREMAGEGKNDTGGEKYNKIFLFLFIFFCGGICTDGISLHDTVFNASTF